MITQMQEEEMKKYQRYSVVLRYERNGISLEDWNEIVDSTTRSGATRKAKTLVRDAFGEITKKQQIDNYEYWTVEV